MRSSRSIAQLKGVTSPPPKILFCITAFNLKSLTRPPPLLHREAYGAGRDHAEKRKCQIMGCIKGMFAKHIRPYFLSTRKTDPPHPLLSPPSSAAKSTEEEGCGGNPHNPAQPKRPPPAARAPGSPAQTRSWATARSASQVPIITSALDLRPSARGLGWRPGSDDNPGHHKAMQPASRSPVATTTGPGGLSKTELAPPLRKGPSEALVQGKLWPGLGGKRANAGTAPGLAEGEGRTRPSLRFRLEAAAQGDSSAPHPKGRPRCLAEPA